LRELRRKVKRLEQKRDVLKRATALFARETETRVSVYRHISAERAHCNHPVSPMCELLGVSEAGYWAWCTRPPSDRELADVWLIEQIRRIHGASGGGYGSPRVHAMFVREGLRVGEKRVARLMAGGPSESSPASPDGLHDPPGVEPFADRSRSNGT
jgi:HTH-like domain